MGAPLEGDVSRNFEGLGGGVEGRKDGAFFLWGDRRFGGSLLSCQL